jgi:hypothetical protein
VPDLHRLRWRVVDAPDSIAARYRRKRWNAMYAQFPDLERMSVIDLGGRISTWVGARTRPAHVHIVNLEPPDADVPEWTEVDHADACELPKQIASRQYDLVFSNSVLEHLGGHARRLAFADATHSLSDRHWIQTPYRYFPIEPHWLFPWFQHFPVATRTAIARRWPLVHSRTTETTGSAVDAVMSVELLSRTEMQRYFPDSRIVAERIGPMVKSIIAVR